jgi:hypothetical protein
MAGPPRFWPVRESHEGQPSLTSSLAEAMNPEPEKKKSRRKWVLIILALAAFATYLAVVYPVAKAARAARDQQHLNH